MEKSMLYLWLKPSGKKKKKGQGGGCGGGFTFYQPDVDDKIPNA